MVNRLPHGVLRAMRSADESRCDADRLERHRIAQGQDFVGEVRTLDDAFDLIAALTDELRFLRSQFSDLSYRVS